MRSARFRELPRVATPVEGAKEDDAVEEDSFKEATEFYLLKRAPAGEELPVERYLVAKRHADRMPQFVLSDRRFLPRAAGLPAAAGADLGKWQSLGPGNVGGRTRSLVIDPTNKKIMYAGAVGGGVWKTIDGGEDWKPMSDLIPSIGIGALAMDPRDSQTLYAGTGEWYTGGSPSGDGIRGLGIFKTTDGGQTWNQLPATATTSFYYVNKIVISPNNSQRIYAATYGGIWASPDGGARWTRVFTRASPDLGCQDLVIRTDQATDYLFASCLSRATGTSSAIFRNTDAAGGGRWEQVFAADNMDRASLAVAPSNQSIVYAMAATHEPGSNLNGLLGVYRSTANGDPGSWETRATAKDDNRINRVLLTNPRSAFNDVCSGTTPTFTNQGTYDNVIAVDPLNPDIVWAGGIDVFRSDDGGANWGIAAFWQAAAPRLVHADVHVLLFAPGYGVDNQSLFAATDGGIFQTDNPLAATATGERAACSPYPAAIEWSSINNTYSVTQFYHGAVYPGGAFYAGGAQDNGTNRGADAWGIGGWRSINTGDGGYFAVDPRNPNNIYTESQNFNLIRSTDGGNSYLTATRGITEPAGNFLFITPFEMDPNESRTLYAGGRTLWRTVDGAQNWNEVSASIGTASGSISAIAVAPSDSKRVIFGTSAGFIFRTPDVTAADVTTVWTSVQPRTGYLSHLTFDPANPDIVYATYSQFISLAGQNHIYKSIDGGASWTGIDGLGDTGIPDVPVFSLIADPRNPSNLYLGTDIGLFVSIDGGATWARDNNPFANSVTETLVLDRSAGQTNLFAFTHGRGVWRTTLPGGEGQGCEYKIPGDAISASAFGGTVSFDVATSDGCAWSAVASAVFPVRSPAGGRGSGTVTISVPQNNMALERSALIAIQNQTVAIQQSAAVLATGNDDQASPASAGELPAVVIANSSDATEAASDPVHSCTKSADSKTLWFQLIANDTGTLRLSFASRRLDTGTDSGVVLSVYDSAATELICSVQPQASTNVFTTRTLARPVTRGDTFLIEVSATTFNAPANATLKPGSLTLAAQIVKP